MDMGIAGTAREVGSGSSNEIIFEFLYAMCFGAEAAELVFHEQTTGPDKDLFTLSKCHLKPRWAWAFRVNRFLDILALRCWTIDGWQDVEREKFAILSWRPKHRNPQGTSILRVPFLAWNGKTETYPDHREFLHHFADPSLVVTAGENQQSKFITNPSGGQDLEVTPQEQNLEAATQFKNRSILSLPHGASATFMTSNNTGQAYETGFDRWDRTIFRSIILAVRAMQEAKHGSKADTESNLDLFALAIASARKPPIRMIERDILFRDVELNWGREVAVRHTPRASFGISDHVAPELLKAFSTAWQTGLFGPQQRPWLLHKLGAPAEDLPDPGTDPDGPGESVPSESTDE